MVQPPYSLATCLDLYKGCLITELASTESQEPEDQRVQRGAGERISEASIKV